MCTCVCWGGCLYRKVHLPFYPLRGQEIADPFGIHQSGVGGGVCPRWLMKCYISKLREVQSKALKCTMSLILLSLMLRTCQTAIFKRKLYLFHLMARSLMLQKMKWGEGRRLPRVSKRKEKCSQGILRNPGMTRLRLSQPCIPQRSSHPLSLLEAGTLSNR